MAVAVTCITMASSCSAFGELCKRYTDKWSLKSCKTNLATNRLPNDTHLLEWPGKIMIGPIVSLINRDENNYCGVYICCKLHKCPVAVGSATFYSHESNIQQLLACTRFRTKIASPSIAKCCNKMKFMAED